MSEKRISTEQKDDGILIKIKALKDESKQKNLSVWLLAWTFCGLAVAYQLILEANSDIKTALLIFMAFWAYFEFKVVKVFRWRRGGEEQFFISEEKLLYGRTIKNRGILRPYRKDLVNSVRNIDEEHNTFSRAFADSYWVIGGERLAFTVNGKIVAFGLRLSDKEAKKLTELINKHLG